MQLYFKFILSLLLLPIAVLLLGSTHQQSFDQVLIPKHVVEVIGQIEKLHILPRGHNLSLLVNRIDTMPILGNAKVRVRVMGNIDHLKIGDSVSLLAVLKSPSPSLYPGGYDFKAHAKLSSLIAVGYAVSDVTIVASSDHFLDVLEQWRLTLVQRFYDRDYGALVIALLFGERRAIDRSLIEDIRSTGIAHLFAISGLHVALVCGWIYIFFRLLLILIPSIYFRVYAKHISAGISIVLSFGYIWLAGFPISAQRAYIMGAFFLLAVVLSRHTSPLRHVAIAALLLLFIEPETLFSPGFQMSFAAVTALIGLLGIYWRYRPNNYQIGRLSKIVRFFIATFLSSLVAGIATMPFAIYHFNQFSSYGLIANMIAVPLTSLWIMPWGICALVLSFVSLESIALFPMELGLRCLVSVANTISRWPDAMYIVPSMSAIALVIISLLGLWIILSTYSKRFIIGLPLIFILTFSGYAHRVPSILLDYDPIGRFAVYYDDHVMMFSQPPPSKFVRSIWLAKTASTKGDSSKRLLCDIFGCTTTLSDGRVAVFITYPAAFASACEYADVVINFTYLRYYCTKKQLVVSRYDVWKQKAPYFIW